jgi:hypothetical protein
MKFVDRAAELAFLERHFESNGSELIVIWGRRRVGKTRLLQEFARGHPLAYHLSVRTTAQDELGRLSTRLADFFDDDLLRAQPLTSYQALFAYLAGRPAPFGLVLDEFPYLVEASPELPSLLQAAWDERLSASGIKLILCGSSMAMMERSLLAPSAPLCGRRSGQWKVEPFGPAEVAEMLDQKLVQALETFAVVGGVPMYLEQLDPRADLGTNIRERILRKGELLYDEVGFLLRQELRQPRVYQAILAAIAQGAKKVAELGSKTGLDKANLSRYLAQLTELNLVRRDVPVTERLPHKSRKGLYRVADPFVRFWYRFVYPNLDLLELLQGDQVFAERIRPRLHQYISTCVEAPLADLFTAGPLSHLVPFQVRHAGRHWSHDAEFDLVLFDETRRQAFVGEVKWSLRPISPRHMGELNKRIQASRVFEDCRLTTALVSRSGFSSEPEATTSEIYVDLSAVDPTPAEPT